MPRARFVNILHSIAARYRNWSGIHIWIQERKLNTGNNNGKKVRTGVSGVSGGSHDSIPACPLLA
jgi:hypothetical protein